MSCSVCCQSDGRTAARATRSCWANPRGHVDAWLIHLAAACPQGDLVRTRACCCFAPAITCGAKMVLGVETQRPALEPPFCDLGSKNCPHDRHSWQHAVRQSRPRSPHSRTLSRSQMSRVWARNQQSKLLGKLPWGTWFCQQCHQQKEPSLSNQLHRCLLL